MNTQPRTIYCPVMISHIPFAIFDNYAAAIAQQNRNENTIQLIDLVCNFLNIILSMTYIFNSG